MMTMKQKIKRLISVLTIVVLFGANTSGSGLSNFLNYVQVDAEAINEVDMPYELPNLLDADGNRYLAVPFTLNDMNTVMNMNTNISDKKVNMRVRTLNGQLQWVIIDLSRYPDLKEVITVKNKTYKINPYYLARYGFVVYGTPNDVSNNVFDNGWKYLGYNEKGEKYINIYYGMDEVYQKHPWERTWIKYPWNHSEVRNAPDGITEPSSWYKTGQRAYITDLICQGIWPDKTNKNYKYIFRTGMTDEYGRLSYDETIMPDFFHLVSAPTKYGNGEIKGWFYENGKLKSQTFLIPAETLVDILDIVPHFQSGNFKITYDSKDYTSSTLTEIIEKDYGKTNYNLTLGDVTGFTKIREVKWYKFRNPESINEHSTNYTADYIGSGLTLKTAVTGSEEGSLYAYGAVVTYEVDGNLYQYPEGNSNELHDNYIFHTIKVREIRVIDENPVGQITFTPTTSYNIADNREGWVNKNASINVVLQGSSTKTASSYATRWYTYWESYTCSGCQTGTSYCDGCKKQYSDWVDCPCVFTDHPGYNSKGNVCGCMDGAPYGWYATVTWYCPGHSYTYCSGHSYSNSGSTTCGYTEVWRIAEIEVSGTGKDVNGKTVNLPKATINGTSGTYVISQELKDIQLTAKVTKWEVQSTTWNSSYPPRGSWDSGSPPKGKTTKPTETYESSSGLFYIDKTSPFVQSISSTKTGWTNQPYTVDIAVSDNLSGFWRDGSHLKVTDKSYYKRETEMLYFGSREPKDEKSILLDEDGIYSIEVNLEDVAKNKMNRITYGDYKIDMTSPYNATFSDDTRQYIDDNLTVTVKVGDNLSGLTEVKYILNNHPDSYSGGKTVNCSTAEGKQEYKTFTVNITDPGSWWIHVYQKDRAGNITWTTSREYKIVRIDTPQIGPVQANNKYPRGTRFDVTLATYGLTGGEAILSEVVADTPAWINDSVNYEKNGKYMATTGRVVSNMNYYDGKEKGSQEYADKTTGIAWWSGYVPPYGQSVTINRNGTRLKDRDYITLYVRVPDYNGPKNTHSETVYFDIIPETQIKTEIINNSY